MGRVRTGITEAPARQDHRGSQSRKKGVFEKSPKKVKGDFDNNRFRPETDALPKQEI
jgi:hypothetical protein